MERVLGGETATRIFGRSPEARLALLRAAWVHVAGPELARRTEVLAIEGHTLRIRVTDARWRKVLHRMQGDLIPRLRQLAGNAAPRRLGFTEGGLVEALDPGPRSRISPERDAPPPEVVELASRAIADPELRLRFVEAAGRYLRRSACAKP